MKIKIFKRIMIIIGSILMFIFLAPIFGLIFHIGNIVGICIAAVFLVIGIWYEKIIEIIKKICSNKKGKAVFKTAMSLIGVFTLSFIIVLSSVVISSRTTATNQSTVIILGCAVQGKKPSAMLYSRIKAAGDYLNDNPKSVAVLSGGQGHGEKISEAKCMYNVLTENMGIDPSRLYLEDTSTNTAENIANSKKIIEQHNLSTDVAVATSDFHLKRATMICKDNDLTAHTIAAHYTFYSTPAYYLREVLGVYKEFVF